MIRKKTLIILAIIVLVVIGLAIALLLTNVTIFSPVVKENLNENVNQAEMMPQLPEVVETKQPQATLTSTEQHITTVARNFAERFASFSTDSKYANLKEVKLLSSARLSRQLESMMTTGDEAESYYGVSSKVLKVKINILDEAQGIAHLTVTLQREETKQGQSPVVYYQNLELSLIASGEEWLVDSFKWES